MDLMKFGDNYMSKKDEIITLLKDLPEDYAGEVLDFVQFIKKKYASEKYENTMLSESSLKKEWLLPEEDDAWADL